MNNRCKSYIGAFFAAFNLFLFLIAAFNLFNLSLIAYRVLLALAALQVGLYKIEEIYNKRKQNTNAAPAHEPITITRTTKPIMSVVARSRDPKYIYGEYQEDIKERLTRKLSEQLRQQEIIAFDTIEDYDNDFIITQAKISVVKD